MKFKIGFTLIEVLVAMAIVILLSTAGVGSLRKNTQRKVVENAATNVAAMLRKAQTNAAGGVKYNCIAQPLKGWQVIFDADNVNYHLQEACENGSDTIYPVFSVQDEKLPTGTSFSASTPAPILFRVVGQGVKFGSGTYIQPISITGFSTTISISVNTGGEITQVVGTISPSPTPVGVCTLITHCSSVANGIWESYVPTNATACTTMPNTQCAGSNITGAGACTQGTNLCVCRQNKSCCTTALGASRVDCEDQGYVILFNKVLSNGAVKQIVANKFKSLRVRFTTAQTGKIDYCGGESCTTYNTKNFTNATTVELPSNLSNTIFKLITYCNCTVIVEGVFDTTKPPLPAPANIFFDDFSPQTSELLPSWENGGSQKKTTSAPRLVYMEIDSNESAILIVNAIYHRSIKLKYYWSGDGNVYQGVVEYCLGSNCSNFSQIALHNLSSVTWSGQQTINIPADFDVVRVRFSRVNGLSSGGRNFNVDDVALEGVDYR